MQAYSNEKRSNDKYALPDLEVFELTAEEVAGMDEELIHQYTKRHEFRLATMNGTIREKMIQTIVEEEGLSGGWFYQYCLPGCMPDSGVFGPYASAKEALSAAQEDAKDFSE
jgi:hypothetical protein